MKIAAVEVVPYALPFKEPYVTARGRLERRELVLVKLHADGLVGLGETAPLSLRGGDSLARIVEDLRAFDAERGASIEAVAAAALPHPGPAPDGSGAPGS